jgi:hypothetical protein
MSNQPKRLQLKPLVPKDEFHPGGFFCTIIDNDGSTVIKEWWEPNEKTAILHCRNWLKLRAGEEIDFNPKDTNDAEPGKVGQDVHGNGADHIQNEQGPEHPSGSSDSQSG